MATQSDMVRVRNHRPSLVTLPNVTVVRTRDGKTKSVHDAVLNESAGYVPLDSFVAKTLMPGVNYVLRSYMEALKNHAGVNHLFDSGVLEVVQSGEPYIPENVANSLDGTEEANAIRLVSIAADVPQLKRWLHNEKRPAVSEAVAMRIKALESGEARPGRSLKREATGSLGA